MKHSKIAIHAMQLIIAAVNGGGEQALAVKEPSESSVDAIIKHEHSPSPPLPETDANELREADAEEEIHKEQRNGKSLTRALSNHIEICSLSS